MSNFRSISGPLSASSSFIALLASSCCVLPILLVQMGMASSLVMHLAWFDQYQDIFFITALATLMLSLIVSLINGLVSKALIIWWIIGVIFIVSAWTLPHYEFVLQRWLLEMFQSR